jgi:NHLM bacteriocin system ABC transporter peptidase/ATP-binding protein
MAPRTPIILQMEGVEAGAAALAIVLAYRGRWVPLEAMREACGVSRDGTSVRGIVEAARRYGLDACAQTCPPDALRKVRKPAIVPWQSGHYVVLERLTRRHAVLNDPARGRRTIARDAFDVAYRGLILTFRPTDAFRKGGPQPKLRALAAPLMRRVAPGLGLFFLLGLMLVVPGVVVPAFTKIFVDRILVEGNADWLRPLVVAMILVLAFQALTMWLQYRTALRIRAKLSAVRTAQFMRHLLRLPHVFFTQRAAADLLGRVRKNHVVARLAAQDLVFAAVQLVSIVFFAGAMLLFDPVLTAIVVGLFAVAVAASLRALGAVQEATTTLEVDNTHVLTATVAGLRSIETVKAAGAEGFAFARWAGFHARSLRTQSRLSRLRYLLNVLPVMAGGLAIALVLGIGSLRIMEGAITIGSLVAFQLLTVSFMAPLVWLVDVILKAQQLKAGLSWVANVDAFPEDPRFATPPPSLPLKNVRLGGRIELRDVTFGYDRTAPPLVDGLSLTVEPGARVALVGATGSGKSTVARLMAGLYHPWSGAIRYDDVPLEEIPNAVLVNSIGWVDQDIVLFAGTVRDNITLWDDTVPDPAVVRAAHDARIHDDIALRPGGYDAPIRERGANVSGGQAQRIEIARRLVRSPTILVLDEAMSALDPVVEREIDLAIRRRGCTQLVIAHRLSTIRDADEILVLDHGRIAERGHHDELVARGGLYRALVED